MDKNNYSWNQTLKFSWGHIIAFVALIFISYVTFMGDFYQNGGDFTSAVIKVCYIDMALLITFLGAQILKGTDEKFARSIIFERILICLCPIAFVWAFVPYNHFWNVFSERQRIESLFNKSIGKSRQMFSDYENYSNDRIMKYENTLEYVLKNKTKDKQAYIKAGFNGTNDEIVKGNYIETLKLQLLSENTDSLCKSAFVWIEEANQGASVWNAFLIGNVENISEAIKGWNSKLSNETKPILSNEALSGIVILPFDEKQESFMLANKSLAELREIYTDTYGNSINALWSSALLFLMMLFPYFLQRRNEKAKGYYVLIPGIKMNTCLRKSTISPQSISENPVDDREKSTGNKREFSNNDDIYSGTF